MTGDAPEKPLRPGWTTGACAAAAAVGALRGLVSGVFPETVTIRLPKGRTPSFALHRTETGGAGATASVVKDAGDDPDVTHGAEITATVERGADGGGVTFRAGPGVGTVTRPGLRLAPGEPAINPGPREQITENLEAAARDLGVPCDLVVTLSVPGGDALAEKTLNPRLGIVGGISILGTTGVVVPYSCSAWIHSIHAAVDVARATGLGHVAASTGRTSEAAAKKMLGLPDEALIEMGDFAGGLLKYLRRNPVERLTLAGGFAKLAKLAQGEMDLHSARSRVDLDALAALAPAAAGANTAAEALERAPDLGPEVAARARKVALDVLQGAGIALDVLVFDRAGGLVGKADG